jgi:hypothetical protein
MSKGGILRTGGYAGAIGLLVGALVIFLGIVNVITEAKPKPIHEPSHRERGEAAFMSMARDDWIYKKKDGNHVLGRIADAQAQEGDLRDFEATVARIDAQELNPDVVRNVSVYDYLHHKVVSIEKPTLEAIEPAKKIAESIKDPLLKADALRRVGEVQLRADVGEAKKTLQMAANTITTPMPPPLDPPPPPLFNPTMLLWPAGLAVFGLLVGLCLHGLMGSLPGRATKVVAEEEEEEEEEEAPAAAEAPLAEAPPMAEPPPMVDVPVASDEVAAEAAAAEAFAGEVPFAGAPLPMGSSALSRAATEQQAGEMVAAADPKKTMMGRQAVPTQLARQQPKPTQLARQAPAKPTMLAPVQAMLTKVAETDQPMELPTGKTAKK